MVIVELEQEALSVSEHVVEKHFLVANLLYNPGEIELLGQARLAISLQSIDMIILLNVTEVEELGAK